MFKNPSYIMIMVSDMPRSVAFYRDVLGLAMKFESTEWTEFNTGTTTVALHGGGKTPSLADKGEKSAGTCSIGFSVPNLDETYNALKTRGVRFVMPPTKREGEGIKLAIGLDPDGMPISFAESARS